MDVEELIRTESSDVKYDVVSFNYFKNSFKKLTATDLTKSDFYSLNLITKDDYLTNAGLLFSDEGHPNSQIFCTRWNGLTKSNLYNDANDSKEFKGSLMFLFDMAEAFVKSHSKQGWYIKGAKRNDIEEYPLLTGVRESIVNSIGTEIHIDIFDDRMEVSSPGGMKIGMQVQDIDIFNLYSERRNKVVADILNRVGLMERRGSGLARIYESYNDFDLKPTFTSDNNRFKVVLPSKIYKSKNKLSDDSINDSINQEKIILTAIKENVNITRKELAKSTNLSVSSVDRYIKKLKDNGLIDRIGSNKAGSWKVLNN